MSKVLSLYEELRRRGVRFYHWNMGEDQAATMEMDGRWAVFMDFANIPTAAEELVIVAHEGGHVSTGATHRVDSPYDLVEKHEYKADKWAVQRLIGREELAAAVEAGMTAPWELAEHFGVTEDFMRKALCWYRNGNLSTGDYW